MKYKNVLQKVVLCFVGILLVLTFFSQTIVDMRLPRVVLGFAEEGTIANEAWSFGQVAATGDVGRFEVIAEFPIIQDFIRPRLEVAVQVQGRQFDGVVSQVTPSGGTNTVIIDVESSDLTGGEFAEVQVSGGRFPAPIMLPLSALRQDINGFYVLYVQPERRLIGSSYYVNSTRVNVVRRDMWSAAISGDSGAALPDAPFVVGSDMPISRGQRVRLVGARDLDLSW